jgi:uncharacterized protein
MTPTLLAPAAATAAPTELFFSEYVEGTSNNKALEIYNGTGATVDLATQGYNVQMYFNGSASAGLTIALTGTVAHDDVFVLAHGSAVAAVLDQADQTNGAGWFNGDDAVALRKGPTLVDVIGQIGFRPSTEWGSGLTSTADNTLRRKPSVTAGDPDGTDAFDPAVEWDGYATDTFDGLGFHTIAPPAPPVINEFVANHVGTDTHEFVEVRGAPSTGYGAYTILQLEGDGAGAGVIDSVHPVGTTNSTGHWTTPFLTNVLENGTMTLLLVRGFTGAVGNDLDTNDDGILDVTPWTSAADGVAVSDGGAGDRTYTGTVLASGFGGSGLTPGGASRFPDGTDTDTVADWLLNDFDGAGLPGFVGSPVFGEASNTPGATNVAVPPVDVCTLASTPAYELQGSGPESPLVGQVVTTQGVVVGDYEGPSPALRGFYLQDPTGDGDPATSDGVFVFNGTNDQVSLGQVVRVTGTVGEFQGQTQLSNLTALEGCGTGTVDPVDVTLPVPSADHLERYEGMLVRMPQTLHVTEHFQLGRFGQVVMSSGGRLEQPTNVVAPGAAAQALQAANDLNRIIVDDHRNDQNPDPILFGRGGHPLSAASTLRGGDTATGMQGVMTYTWSGNAASGNAYRLRPVAALGGGVPDFQPTNPRPTTPPDVGGTVEVAAFNLLNYFNTFSGCTGGVGGAAMDCRGADNAAEFARQWPKTVAAITAMDVDVLGVMEMENDGYGPGSAIEDLRSRLDTATAPGTWAFVDVDAATGRLNALGTDAIKVGFLYKPGSVTPIGDTAALDTTAFVNGGDGAPRNRPALAQAFATADGAAFVASVNHLKSKGSACDAPDAGDGQANCNAVRTVAAGLLADWLATDPTGTGDPDVLIMGDLNSYAKEDPIALLENAGYASLVGPEAYSYVFDGQWGSLDHALASETLTEQVSGAAEWHVNADEPGVLDYNTNFKSPGLRETLYAPDAFRSSDHDPIVIGLDLANQAPSVGPITVEPALLAVGGSVAASAPFTDADTTDMHTASWDWGDGSTSAGTVSGSGGSGSVSGTHVYTIPGVYPVTLTVTDSAGKQGSALYEYVVVHDPTGGFVTGGGQVEGADGHRANFGFTSKYVKGKPNPRGNLVYSSDAAGLHFESARIDWLVVAPDGRSARFAGTGILDDVGNHRFEAWVGDGPDTFRITITKDDVTYDSGGGPILRGSIQVH